METSKREATARTRRAVRAAFSRDPLTRYRVQPVQFEIAPTTREALDAWIKAKGPKGDSFLFPSRVALAIPRNPPLRARIVHHLMNEIGLDTAAYGTHSLRRTKPSLIYRRTKNLRAVQLLLGHSKLESTVRYLGIDVDDALEIAEQGWQAPMCVGR